MSLAGKKEKIELIQLCDEFEDSSGITKIRQNYKYTLQDYGQIDCGEYFTSAPVDRIVKKQELSEFVSLTPIYYEQKQTDEFVDLTESISGDTFEDRRSEFLDFSDSTSFDVIEIEEECILEKCIEDRDPLALFSDTVEPNFKEATIAKVFRCTFAGCAATFAKSGNLQKHISSVHKPLVKCPHEDCGHFVASPYLHNHIRSAHDKTQCWNCKKSFFSNFINRHVEECLKDKEKKFQCSECDCVFQTKISLSMHFKVHKYPLEKCPFENCNSLQYSHRLNGHITRVHREIKKLFCKYEILPGKECGLLFDSRKALSSHVKAVHGVTNCETEILPRQLSKRLNVLFSSPEKCPYDNCYSLVKPRYLKRHIEGVHKKQTCDTCKMEFSCLKSHLKRGCSTNKIKYGKHS